MLELRLELGFGIEKLWRLMMVNKNFEGKKAIIAGASGGMGSVIFKMLSSKGVHCALFGRDENKLESTRSACSSSGAECSIFSCDISSP